MEAAHTARQARLASLREAKDKFNPQDKQQRDATSPSIHPFRRAFLLTPSLRTTSTPTQTPSALADSTAETQLLRKFRNWDPMTGQARQGLWNTIQGIEDDVRDVQQQTLKQEEQTRTDELNLTALAPRKPNWDLRNHWLKRLKKLNRTDKEARLALIRQRLKAAKSSSSANTSAVQADLAMSTAVEAKGRSLVPGLDGSDDEEDSD